MFPNAKVVLFGSSAAYLAVQGSDIDILVHDNSEQLTTLFNQTYQKLNQANRFSRSVEKIVCAVPILKVRDKKTGIYCDITFNREDCFKGVITSLALQMHYPELRPLYFVVKCFLRERGSLDKTKRGGVCSFMLLNMVVAYLQTQYKESANRVFTSWQEPLIQDEPLHQHLLKFFRHYGHRLD